MLIKNPIFICCLALIVGLFGLVQVKMHVHQLDKEIRALRENKSNLVNEIKILDAEWTYLNRAERLETLARKYLRAEEPRVIRDINDFGQQHSIYKKKSPKPVLTKVTWNYKSREQIFTNVKGLKHIGSHGIVKVKGTTR